MVDRKGSIARALAIAVLMGSAGAAPLDAQNPALRRATGPSLRDTIAVLLTVASRGDVNLRGVPSLTPATSCFLSPAACKRRGYWTANEARGRALLDSVHAIILANDSAAAGDPALSQRLELTAPVFLGPRHDSASVEAGVRARLRPGPRGYFESDAHVTLVRDAATNRWRIVRWFTHRVT